MAHLNQQVLFSLSFVVCLFIAMVLVLEAGRRLGRRSRHEADNTGTGFGAVEGAVFGLLGLLIAFSFSGASNRFNARRALIAEEANAAEAAYMYVDLLPEGIQTNVRDLIREYLDLRIAIYRRLPNFEYDSPEMKRSEELRKRIWSLATRAGPEPNEAVLAALMRMFEDGNLRIDAHKTHAPGVLYGVLVIFSLACALLAGYGMSSSKARSWTHIFGFALILAISVYLILDLEHPRAGLINIESYDQVLVNARNAMK